MSINYNEFYSLCEYSKVKISDPTIIMLNSFMTNRKLDVKFDYFILEYFGGQTTRNIRLNLFLSILTIVPIKDNYYLVYVFCKNNSLYLQFDGIHCVIEFITDLYEYIRSNKKYLEYTKWRREPVSIDNLVNNALSMDNVAILYHEEVYSWINNYLKKYESNY